MEGKAVATWLFCLRSIGREYGAQFLLKIVLPHPIRTFKGLKAYMRDLHHRCADDSDRILNPAPGFPLSGPPPVLGLGFCLKPLDPVCLSGRFNHDCHYFEHNLANKGTALPTCCLNCKIRTLGETAMRAGFSLYIMTSARDILDDLLVPALREEQFKHALLVLCNYSIEPFKIALSAVGLSAQFIPFQRGDCQDYRSWRRADKGIKEERTEISSSYLAAIQAMLGKSSPQATQMAANKSGHIFYPNIGTTTS
jgi:hypothetical protein